MIKNFEPIYNETENLFIKKLPEYIEKINKKYNDGLLLQQFTNNNLEEKCIMQPYFIYELVHSEYLKKDRIIEVTNYCIEIKLLLPEKNKGGKVITFWRYIEAITMMLNEHESELRYEVTKTFSNTIQITIFNE